MVGHRQSADRRGLRSFLQNAFDTVPLGLEDWLWILAVSLPVFFIGEAVKAVQWRKARP